MTLTKNYTLTSVKIDPANDYVRLVEFSIDITSDDYPGAMVQHGGLIDVSFAQLLANSPLEDFVMAIESFFVPQRASLDRHFKENLAFMHLSNGLTTAIPTVAPAPTTEMINAERSRRIDAGATLMIPGYGLIALQGRDEDQRNLNARATAATLKKAQGDDSLMIFRDANNVNHELTPDQMILVFAIGSAWVEGQYKASWAIKDLQPVPADYTDDKYWV